MRIAVAVLLGITVATAVQAQPQAGAPPSAGVANINGGQLYYEVAGAGGHTLVFIHGGQMDSRMWDEQFALFSRSYRVVRYDFRGYGKSPAPTHVFAGEEDLAALLKFLRIQKATVVGLSLGGRVAIDFALVHPEMAEAIVAVAPGLSGFHFSDDPNMLESWRAAQDGDWRKVTELWLKSGYMAPAMRNPQIAARLRELAYDNAHQFLDNGALERILSPPAIDRLADLRVATLVMVGNLDVIDIHEICGLLRARVPRVREVLIPGAGHIVNMEKPAQFNAALQEFLSTVLQ
jgi:pimeloyl-ACP methyl ester carboxylesterase